MPAIAYGSKYDRALRTPDIAKRFREDLKAAIAAKEIPKITCSVRSQRFAGGSSITVEVTAIPTTLRLLGQEYLQELQHAGSGTLRYTAEARDLLSKLEAMLAAYNFDGSDTMSDYFYVNFYAHVNFDHRLEDAERDTHATNDDVQQLATGCSR